MLVDLPEPSAAELEHSDATRAHIVSCIEAAGGQISFAEYMDLALYAPGLGYYSGGARKFGADGDFVTAPEISPLFSQCLADQVAEVLGSLGGGSILELGAGSGVMASDILLELERLDSLPDEYLILERSAELRERQLQTLVHRAPQLREKVRWLDTDPDTPIKGVVLANEVLDALPVERFRLSGDTVSECFVTVDSGNLVSGWRPASEPLQTAVKAIRSLPEFNPADGYESELCLVLPAWLQAVGGWLEQGVALFLDYGYPRHEYYFPERSSGTVRCYYRHRAHEDPLIWPGLQDITAWVDFSYLAEAALDAGFAVSGYTTQANFLLASGLDSRVDNLQIGSQEHVQMAAGLRQLLLPGEMGESVKVIALGRGGVAAPSAMRARDMRPRLQVQC